MPKNIKVSGKKFKEVMIMKKMTKKQAKKIAKERKNRLGISYRIRKIKKKGYKIYENNPHNR